MMKMPVFALATVLAAGCNQSKKTDGAESAAGPAQTTATPAVTNVLLQKALSFVTGGPFEGAITMSIIKGDKPPESIVYIVKGTKMRFNVPVAGSYAILDTTTHKMTTVTDSRKTAMVLDMSGAFNKNAGPNMTKASIEKTGKTDTVAGYACDVWKVTEPNGSKTDLCVADGISFPISGREAPAWASELGNGFPLRAITTDGSGKETNHMLVTQIDKKTIDDAQFTVPPDYKTVDMTAMLGGLGGGLKHP